MKSRIIPNSEDLENIRIDLGKMPDLHLESATANKLYDLLVATYKENKDESKIGAEFIIPINTYMEKMVIRDKEEGKRQASKDLRDLFNAYIDLSKTETDLSITRIISTADIDGEDLLVNWAPPFEIIFLNLVSNKI